MFPASFLTGITTDISVVLDMFSIAIIECIEINSYFNYLGQTIDFEKCIFLHAFL